MDREVDVAERGQGRLQLTVVSPLPNIDDHEPPKNEWPYSMKQTVFGTGLARKGGVVEPGSTGLVRPASRHLQNALGHVRAPLFILRF